MDYLAVFSFWDTFFHFNLIVGWFCGSYLKIGKLVENWCLTQIFFAVKSSFAIMQRSMVVLLFSQAILAIHF